MLLFPPAQYIKRLIEKALDETHLKHPFVRNSTLGLAYGQPWVPGDSMMSSRLLLNQPHICSPIRVNSHNMMPAAAEDGCTFSVNRQIMFWQRRTVVTTIIVLSSSQIVHHCNSHEIEPRRRANVGLVGYGIHIYGPACAFACRGVLEPYRLNCSTSHDNSTEFQTSPECLASNDAFLISLAFCIDARCTREHKWTIDKFWEVDAIGDKVNQPSPKYSFQTALGITAAQPQPAVILEETKSLDIPSLVGDQEWKVVYSSMRTMTYVEKQSSTFGYARRDRQILECQLNMKIGSFCS
jgi:hypothetical protein